MEIILAEEIKLNNISRITAHYRNQVHSKRLNPTAWASNQGFGNMNFMDSPSSHVPAMLLSFSSCTLSIWAVNQGHGRLKGKGEKREERTEMEGLRDSKVG